MVLWALLRRVYRRWMMRRRGRGSLSEECAVPFVAGDFTMARRRVETLLFVRFIAAAGQFSTFFSFASLSLLHVWTGLLPYPFLLPSAS
jgi:hypothetical protein